MIRTGPLVSVIVPAHNVESFIEAAIDSACRQTYQNIEILVVDDGSRDRTPRIADAIAKRDQRVKVLRQTNGGVAAARNTAISASRGCYIAPLDADDIWHPRKIEQQMRCMLSAASNVGVVYAWSFYVDEQARLTGGFYAHDLPRNVYAALIFRNVIGCASVPLIRRECFERVGMYNVRFAEQNAQGCEDLDLYLRIAEHYDFLAVREFLVGYRQSSGCMSSHTGAMAKSFYLALKECERRRPDIPRAIFRWSLARQCFYLSGRARGFGQRWKSVGLLAKTVRFDPSLSVRPQFYRSLLAGPLRRLRRLSAVRPSKAGKRQGADSGASQPVSIAQITDHGAPLPTPLFDVFEKLYQRRLRFTESVLDSARPADDVPEAVRAVGLRLNARLGEESHP